MRSWLLILILLTPSATGSDLDALCRGWCLGRYQDGFFRDAQCACVDWYPVPGNRLKLPKKVDLSKPPGEGYEGRWHRTDFEND
jgi:hypothetical protein